MKFRKEERFIEGPFVWIGTGWRSIQEILKVLVSSIDNSSLCPLYRFDAVITHAVNCSVDTASDVGVPSKTHQNDQDRN